MALVLDRRHGTARQMIVLGLGKSRDPRIVAVLIQLLADEDVEGHAIDALGQLRATAARSAIEARLAHPKAWIRKQAKRALRRMDSRRN